MIIDTETVSVVVVDDDVILAEALSMAWEHEPGLTIAGLAHTGGEGIALARSCRPDVVLMDHNLPDMTGAEASAALTGDSDGPAVVIMTIEPTDAAMLAAVEAGACGFLAKSQGIRAVGDVVRRAAAGEMLIPAATIARLLTLTRQRQRQEIERRALVERVTSRELEVLQLMAQGLDTRGLADRLVLSQTTVRTHVASVLGKLGAHSRLEAVMKATELGLLT
jgi:two-component system, NarL family, response regulator DevR